MREKTYRIGEAADMLRLKSYVLRFWETEFPQLAPLRTDKGQRLYTDYHIALLHRIRHLLHEQGMTIEGARRVLASTARVDIPLEADASVHTLAGTATALPSPPLAPPSLGQRTGLAPHAADFRAPSTAVPTGEGFTGQPERQPERQPEQRAGHYTDQQATQHMAQQATQAAMQQAGLYAPQPPASPVSHSPPPAPQGNGTSINRTVVREMREELLALRTMLTSDD